MAASISRTHRSRKLKSALTGRAGRVLMGVCAGICVIAVPSGPEPRIQAAGHPCQAELRKIVEWNAGFLRTLAASRFPTERYNSVYQPYRKRYVEVYNSIYGAKDPDRCAASAKAWCAELTRDYADYNVPCAY